MTQAIIDQAFDKFVTDDQNNVDAAAVKREYRCHLHPKVISGACSEDEVFLDFLTNFSDKNRDGRLNRDEWNSYYIKIAEGIH